MRSSKLGLLIVALAFSAGCASNPKSQSEADEAREETRAMARETLVQLEAIQPGATRAVESAYAYAIFSNFGMKIFVAGGGSGRGVAFRRSPREETFMRMAEIQAGLGMGVKKFRLVWVFTSEQVYRAFVDKGWELGAQATAEAQAGEKGGGMAGAVAVAPGVYLYQLTDSGLALELTAKGTKYYRDSGLN